MYSKENIGNFYPANSKQYANQNLRQQRFDYTDSNKQGIKDKTSYQFYQPTGYEDRSSKDSYSRSGNHEWPDKYGIVDKDVSNHFETYHKNKDSFVGGSQQYKMDAIDRRQTAKMKNIQMRTNNINTINDKINNLLNLVKKERVEIPNNQRLHTPSPRNLQRNLTYHHNQPKYPSPVEAKKQKAHQRENEDEDYSQSKRNNKSIQRLRALSTLEPNLAAKHTKLQANRNIHLQQSNNQEDWKNSSGFNDKKYSPFKGSNQSGSKSKQKSAKNNALEHKYYQQIAHHLAEEERLKRFQQKKHYMHSHNQEQLLGNNQRLVTPNKDQRIDQYKHRTFQSSKKFQNLEITPDQRRYEQNAYIPISLIQKQNKPIEAPKKNIQRYSGIKIVDEQIRRIKEKMGQKPANRSNQNGQYQSPIRQEFKPRFDNRQTPNNSSKKFQLNVLPVKNDRPQTIKIAQKLCYQIQTDNRMKRAKSLFFKIEKQQKWKDLSNQLSQNGLRWSMNDLKVLLVATSETAHHNRAEQKIMNESINELATAFADAQIFWEKHVVGCASLKGLRRQGFDARELDLSQKGHLGIDDLVNFVNKYTSHSYKNQDLFMVFRRLQLLQGSNNLQKVEYSTFMQAFTT